MARSTHLKPRREIESRRLRAELAEARTEHIRRRTRKAKPPVLTGADAGTRPPPHVLPGNGLRTTTARRPSMDEDIRIVRMHADELLLEAGVGEQPSYDEAFAAFIEACRAEGMEPDTEEADVYAEERAV